MAQTGQVQALLPFAADGCLFRFPALSLLFIVLAGLICHESCQYIVDCHIAGCCYEHFPFVLLHRVLDKLR